MENLKWSENMLKDKDAQLLLEEKLSMLIEIHFKGKSDYAIEKFIKSFGEGITYLEGVYSKTEIFIRVKCKKTCFTFLLTIKKHWRKGMKLSEY